eukprot:4537138-Prymnesium_polylepis.1
MAVGFFLVVIFFSCILLQVATLDEQTEVTADGLVSLSDRLTPELRERLLGPRFERAWWARHCGGYPRLPAKRGAAAGTAGGGAAAGATAALPRVQRASRASEGGCWLLPPVSESLMEGKRTGVNASGIEPQTCELRESTDLACVPHCGQYDA